MFDIEEAGYDLAWLTKRIADCKRFEDWEERCEECEPEEFAVLTPEQLQAIDEMFDGELEAQLNEEGA